MNPQIDMHVHLVGNGQLGSGCWLNIGATWWQRPLANYMLRHIGLRGLSLHDPGFDEAYAAHLLECVRGSSIDRIVLLAQDEVHDPDGTRRRDLGKTLGSGCKKQILTLFSDEDRGCFPQTLASCPGVTGGKWRSCG